MCQDFSSEKSPLSFDSRKVATSRTIPLNLRILGGCLREAGLYSVLFLCWSCLRTAGQSKICWRADVHSAKHEQGETRTVAFPGFDRVEKRTIASNKRRNYIIAVSTFCANYVLSLSQICELQYGFVRLSDINECTTNVHTCDANAVCNNTQGSYNCTCSPGYTGNGTSCNGYYQRYLANLPLIKGHVTIGRFWVEVIAQCLHLNTTFSCRVMKKISNFIWEHWLLSFWEWFLQA